jgi:poly(A) polymerase
MMRPFSLAPVTSPAWSDPFFGGFPGIPGLPAGLLEALVEAAAPDRLALVGGAVRDLLRHRVHADPWRGLPDLDLVVEEASPSAPEPAAAATPERSHPSPALRLAARLGRPGSPLVVHSLQEHGAFGTVELELATALPQRLLLDLATARRETYPQPGENPQVRFGTLADDLARRDFTINAMALRLGAGGGLLDPHGGLHDLRARRLRLLHGRSLADDPTRIVRAARYAARLGFELDPADQRQLHTTLVSWPWTWRPGDPPAQAPPALATRLRMELELLLEREPARLALAALQRWGALPLLDPALQADTRWARRLAWGRRFGLPPLATWLVAAHDPLALAQRLQLPHRQQRLLQQVVALGAHLAAEGPAPDQPWSPSRWCALLEAPGLGADAVALHLAAGRPPRRPLWRWWARWRHFRAPLTAAELLAQGWSPGPALGERLRQLRWQRIDHSEGCPPPA